MNKEIGKKVHFCHNKDHFCSCFFILTTNLAKNGYFSENKKPLYTSANFDFGHRCHSTGMYYTVLHSSVDYDINSTRLYVTGYLF